MVGGTADYFVYVPREYVSGTVLGLATGTYNSATFASLGLNEGSYLWSWASDSVTVKVVPIPAAVWLFGSGLGLLGFLRRRQLS
jgi:hypothetical protein